VKAVVGTTANNHDCRSSFGRECYDAFMESDEEALVLVVEYILSCEPALTHFQAEAMAKSDTYRCASWHTAPA
jgi:hypothetical protein